MITEIKTVFPSGTKISVRAEPIEPRTTWSKDVYEPFYCSLVKPATISEMLDTLNALWTAHHAVSISLANDGYEDDERPVIRGRFFIYFHPEMGFTTADGKHTYTTEGLHELFYGRGA